MRGQGRIKGTLVEGDDGHEYLLGFGPSEPPENTVETSKLAMMQIGHTRGLIGPGMGKDSWLWGAFRAALEAFPPIPKWPTWPS